MAMPLYAYRCKKCKTVFEELHKTYNEPTPQCSECNSKDVYKMYHPEHPPLPIFKVRGFYTTDYLGKNSNPGRR